MSKIKKRHYITSRLYKSYNIHYNPRRGTEASTSLCSLIQQRRLTDCLKTLTRLGFSEEQAVVVLASVQIIAGLGGAA